MEFILVEFIRFGYTWGLIIIFFLLCSFSLRKLTVKFMYQDMQQFDFIGAGDGARIRDLLIKN